MKTNAFFNDMYGIDGIKKLLLLKKSSSCILDVNDGVLLKYLLIDMCILITIIFPSLSFTLSSNETLDTKDTTFNGA